MLSTEVVGLKGWRTNLLAELSIGSGTVRSLGEGGSDLSFGERFFAGAFFFGIFGEGSFFAEVFLVLGLGFGMDFYLLVRAQSLDTRKSPNLNQFTYFTYFYPNTSI